MHEHPKPGAKIEIAHVFRRFAQRYRDKHPLADQSARVLRDLEHCRTPALGGHLYRCQTCARDVVLSNSCLNRHCPTCQGPAQYRWIEQRQRRLLNTPYFHAVFTLPAALRAIVHAHRRLLLDLLFRSVAQTLNAFAADPKRLGAQPAFTLVLHTWTRKLQLHPHLHAIVAAGGLSPDGKRWIGVPRDDFLFPVAPVSRLFRGKFLSGLIELCESGAIDLAAHESRALVREAKKQDWVVFAKKPFGGPAQIVSYLGRYTHRVAISSSRLVSISDEQIVFRTRGENTCSLTPDEFIRPFLLHVLPRQFFKIRHYGLLSPANVNTRLARAQELLQPAPPHTTSAASPATAVDPDKAESATVQTTRNVTAPNDGDGSDRSVPCCPHCGGKLIALAPRRLRVTTGSPPDT